jgi:glycosyltransferase involved in cell wall biosynthesis
MKIALVSDAWLPQVNGVVTTLLRTREWLERLQHQVLCVTPEGFRSLPCPTYPEIRLALFAGGRVSRLLRDFAPDAVHLATEGPLGLAARRYCLRNRLPFTTSYHTRFPQYVRARFPIPERWSYAFLRWFHSPAARTMVSTGHIRDELAAHGFSSLALWGRGVDTDLFRPCETAFLGGERPILLYSGRVAVEKNLEAFLSLKIPGTKYVVGDGPALQALRARFPAVVFTGYQHGEALARHVASADVFVFPSRTDTFGLVLLEAMACGVPVAAYPVPGPIDVVRPAVSGCLDEDLGTAVNGALRLHRDDCRRHALAYTWERATRQFLDNLEPRGTGIDAVALL